MISSVQLSEILSGMTLVVKQAGEIIRQNWDKPRQIFHKSATDLVTNTDFAVQEYLEKNLADLLPEALFLGEEHFDPEKWAAFPQDRPVWVVDPLDGTTNFSHGLPQLAISAGLCQKGRPIAGVIYQPLVNECFYAAKGQGAFLDG